MDTSSSTQPTKLDAKEPQIQDFFSKVSRIVCLLLLDKTAPKELHRSVLKFLKIVISLLGFDQGAEKSREITEMVVKHVFGMEKPKRFTIAIRRILGKLISRVGVKVVTDCSPVSGHRLINYVERVKRKERNAKERQRLL